MSTKVDETAKEINHHVPLRQMIYTKKQIGWNVEDNHRKSPGTSKVNTMKTNHTLTNKS